MKKIIRDIKLFLRVYPIAKSRVFIHSNSKYIGPVRMQIAYNEVRTGLSKTDIKETEVTGAIVYLAIAIAYLINVRYKN